MKKSVKLKIIFSVVLAFVMSLTCTFLCYRTDVKLFSQTFSSQTEFYAPNLNTDKDNFKVLMISDLHMSPILFFLNNKSFSALDKVIEKENPDLIVLNGDIVWSFFNIGMLSTVADYFSSKDIPWAYNIGNHDARKIGASATRLVSILENYENSLFIPSFTNVSGVTNYNITLSKNNDIIYSFTILDSGNKFIDKSQTAWYEWSQKQINESAGKAIPNLLFTHVPMLEVKYMYETGEFEGDVNESVSSVSSEANLFEKIKEIGNTKAVFNSHDHINDFWGTYEGVYFKSCAGSGYSGYGTYKKCVNIINIDTNNLSFDCKTSFYE